jgi:hypothetical protein
MRLFGPGLADSLVGCEPAQGLKATAEVVGGDEVGEVRAQLIVCGVVEALDSRLLEGAVHPLDLPVRPRVSRLGQTVLHIVLRAGEFERVGTEELLASEHLLDLVRRPGVAAGLGEVGAVVVSTV